MLQQQLQVTAVSDHSGPSLSVTIPQTVKNKSVASKQMSEIPKEYVWLNDMVQNIWCDISSPYSYANQKEY